jgi:hypothetical protein
MNTAHLSSVGLISLTNDTITSVNNLTLPQGSKAQDLVDLLPSTFCIQKDTFGKDTLCALRIDATPMTINAVNGNIPYTAEVKNYSILFPWHIKSHPDTRP